jgi:hypothetical protein
MLDIDSNVNQSDDLYPLQRLPCDLKPTPKPVNPAMSEESSEAYSNPRTPTRIFMKFQN